MKKYLFFLFLVPFCSFKKTGRIKKTPYLKPYWHHELNLAEPSDICLTTADPSHYYIVGNRGMIVETDSNGKILRHTSNDGSDYEGVCVKDNMMYVVDESLRRIDVMTEKDFKVKRSVQLHYGGDRNKGFEGITWIPSEKKFVMVIEKPAIVYELNEQLQVTNMLHLKQFFELSAITYHDNFLWFLSDEDHEVMKVDPSDYTILQRWKLPVINPEGISFDKEGNLLIVSDDMAQLYKFKIQ